MHLTVIHPFGDYARGEQISDEDKIDEILKGENAGHVVRTADPRDGANGTPLVFSPKKSN